MQPFFVMCPNTKDVNVDTYFKYLNHTLLN